MRSDCNTREKLFYSWFIWGWKLKSPEHCNVFVLIEVMRFPLTVFHFADNSFRIHLQLKLYRNSSFTTNKGWIDTFSGVIDVSCFTKKKMCFRSCLSICGGYFDERVVCIWGGESNELIAQTLENLCIRTCCLEGWIYLSTISCFPTVWCDLDVSCTAPVLTCMQNFNVMPLMWLEIPAESNC